MYGILGAAVVLTVIVFAGLRTRLSPWLIAKIDGNSMYPALCHGERILVRRRDASSLRTGQIVLVSQPTLTEAGDWTWPPADSPVKQRKLMVKRIAMMRGQSVELLGDNVNASTDSREFGLVDVEQIVGVYVRRLLLWRKTNPRTPAVPAIPEAKYLSQRPFTLRTGSEEA
ncbi:S26 family signal peptidase [Catelliglobosispora koreensis]|uniref:S26 family signal peptidase n=1 Tax=Catelliglobosispora koreensis TaxID=129052 RepID=UPI00037292A9|nr:S26 family signal peptidase [Catelliglobosispora koreensis]